MDQYRKNLLRLIQDRPETDLKKASLAMGRNHAYLQQFIYRGTPRYLKEIDRARLALHLKISEEHLIPSEKKEVENMLYGTSERTIIEKYRGLAESERAEFESFLDFLEAKKSKN